MGGERETCAGPAGPYCGAMGEALAPSRRHIAQWRDAPPARGLHLMYGWMHGERAPRLHGVAYAIPRGNCLVLNHCPWCGASIIDRPAAPAPAEAPDAR